MMMVMMVMMKVMMMLVMVVVAMVMMMMVVMVTVMMMVMMMMMVVMVMVMMMVKVMVEIEPHQLTPQQTHRWIQMTMRLPRSNDFSQEIRGRFSLLYLYLLKTENLWNILGNCLMAKVEVEESFS